MCSSSPVLCRAAGAEDINIENCGMCCGSLGFRSVESDCGSAAEHRKGALLGETKLLLQGFWHLRWRGAGQTEVDLDRVIDEPLQGGQSTDHDDTRDQTLPDT